MAQDPDSEQSSSASTVPDEVAAGSAVESAPGAPAASAPDDAAGAPGEAPAESDHVAAESASGATDAPAATEGTDASAPDESPTAEPVPEAPATARVAEAPSAHLPATTPAPAAPPAPAGPSGPGEPPVDDNDEEEENEDDGSGGKMSFLDHLDELRTRLITSFVALAAGFFLCWAFIAPIFDFIMEPLAAVLEEGVRMIYTSAPEYFFLQLKMAALAGLILATPVVMSQVWLFIAPGLYAHEKKFAIPFVAFASFFFIGGTLFGHYILFQVAWAFFAGFGAANEYVEFTPRLQDAFSLYVRLVLACGVIFQLPTLVFFLARMGVVSPQFLIRNFKYAFLLCFVFAAILTPTPDPVTMTVMAGPMIALYGLSIGIAWVFQKRGAE
jgi:sec-independent protein translocase protein TatC